MDTYNSIANDSQNFRAVVKKPYNPRGVSNTKANQINKTNFIASVVDFLKIAGLAKFNPWLVTAIAWMLQSGRFIISPIFVQERKGDAMISEAKVEALRLLTANNLAAVDVGLVRLVFYNSELMERVPGFMWRAPWLISARVLNELTFEEVKEYNKSKTLPLRVRHLSSSPTGIATIGESIVIDLNCSFASVPALTPHRACGRRSSNGRQGAGQQVRPLGTEHPPRVPSLPDGPTVLSTDNKAARDLSYNPEHHDRSKHIARRHFFIRDMVEAKEIVVPLVSTYDNDADFFTKPLPPKRFKMLRRKVMNLR